MQLPSLSALPPAPPPGSGVTPPHRFPHQIECRYSLRHPNAVYLKTDSPSLILSWIEAYSSMHNVRYNLTPLRQLIQYGVRKFPSEPIKCVRVDCISCIRLLSYTENYSEIFNTNYLREFKDAAAMGFQTRVEIMHLHSHNNAVPPRPATAQPISSLGLQYSTIPNASTVAMMRPTMSYPATMQQHLPHTQQQRVMLSPTQQQQQQQMASNSRVISPLPHPYLRPVMSSSVPMPVVTQPTTSSANTQQGNNSRIIRPQPNRPGPNNKWHIFNNQKMQAKYSPQPVISSTARSVQISTATPQHAFQIRHSAPKASSPKPPPSSAKTSPAPPAAAAVAGGVIRRPVAAKAAQSPVIISLDSSRSSSATPPPPQQATKMIVEAPQPVMPLPPPAKLPSPPPDDDVLVHVIDGHVILESLKPFAEDSPEKIVIEADDLQHATLVTCNACEKKIQYDAAVEFKEDSKSLILCCACAKHKREEKRNAEKKTDKKAAEKRKLKDQLPISGMSGGSQSKLPKRPLKAVTPQLRAADDVTDGKKNIEEWTVEEVSEFVRTVGGCEPHAEKFKEQLIDGQALMLMRDTHLINELKMSLGPALKLAAKVQKYYAKSKQS